MLQSNIALCHFRQILLQSSVVALSLRVCQSRVIEKIGRIYNWYIYVKTSSVGGHSETSPIWWVV